MTERPALIICALRRGGAPSTAADVYDLALMLAQEARWPREQWPKSPQQVSAMLRQLEALKCVSRSGMTKENGIPRPLWIPRADFDKTAEIPQPPESARDIDKVAGLTPEQTLSLFDRLQDVADTLMTQRRDALALFDRQQHNLDRSIGRLREQLVTLGLKTKETV
jgi:hypothetical protein